MFIGGQNNQKTKATIDASRPKRSKAMFRSENITSRDAMENQLSEGSEVLHADLPDALSNEIEVLKGDARKLLRRRHELVVLRRNLTTSQPQLHSERSAQSP